MKNKLTHWLILRLINHPSYLFQKIEIQLLYQLTARAFHAPYKLIFLNKNKVMLEKYALFTKSCMESSSIDLDNLYKEAYRLGKKIRKFLGCDHQIILSDCIRLLYQNIEIEIQGNLPGEIIIPSCYFSHFYNAQECMMISALDQGIIEGMIPGGKFEFINRKTQGCLACKAKKEV